MNIEANHGIEHNGTWLIEYSKDGITSYAEEIVPRATEVTQKGALVLKATLAKPPFNPRNPEGWRTYRCDRILSIKVLGDHSSILMSKIVLPKPANDN